MVKEGMKSSKPRPKTTRKSSRNGEGSIQLGRQSKGKLGFNKESRNEKKQITKDPSKVPSLRFAKKKFGDERESKTERKQNATTRLKVPSSKFTKNKDGYEKGFKTEKKQSVRTYSSKFIKKRNGYEKEFKTEKKENAISQLKVPSSKYAKKNIGYEKEPKTEKKENATTQLKVPYLIYPKKKIGDKKKKPEDETTEAKPKRKKRVIRIDPYDTSNKRIDDGIVLNDISNQKKEVKKEEVEADKAELSMNAQFRAIKPSPSILSFVEDNLLGRRRDIELRRAGYNVELSAPLDNIPFSTSSERERIEQSVFRNKMEFFAAAKVSSSFPPPDLPEIAFAGRSNVGKSSLLNALTRQWGVVRTSDKPGHTQSINFFNLGTKLCLVDLPGYGFAYAKEEVKESWEELVKEYVSTRVGLKRVCLLVDTKWGIKPRDHELIHLMERYQTKYQIVLTKTDTVFPLDVARRAMQIEETLKDHRSIVQPLMMVSSKSGAGIRTLRTVIGKLARFVKP